MKAADIFTCYASNEQKDEARQITNDQLANGEITKTAWPAMMEANIRWVMNRDDLRRRGLTQFRD